jgi:hypothetical protein
MLYNLTRIDNETISIHKFSPKLQFIIRIFIFFKNLTGDQASCTVSDSIHRSKAEFHDSKKKNKADLVYGKTWKKARELLS